MPPEANAEFVCARADLLAVDPRPSDAPRPLVGVAAGTQPLVQDVRAPMPAAPGRPERLDDAYERHGTGNLCRRLEPWAGQREVLVTERRTAVDDAEASQHLVDVRSPSAATSVLVQDNLNPQKLAARYEAFPPEAARRLSDRLEVHDPPKPGSGLNMAAIALGVVRRQCLDRRLPDFSTLPGEVAAWQRDRNTLQVKVDWQCTTAEARVTLTRRYPILDPVTSQWTDH
jgi:DDE superfamily endonuclease